MEIVPADARYTALVACTLYRIDMIGRVVAALLAILTFSATGCGSVRGNAPPAGSVIVVAVDRSLTGSTARDNQILLLDSLTKSASESRYLLDLWAYDGDGPVHIWGPDLLPDPDDLDDLQNKNLPQIDTGARAPGRAGSVIGSILREPALSRVPNGRILLLTDGDVPATGGLKSLASAARLVAARRGWRVDVLGISHQNIPAWNNVLAAVLPDRFGLVDERDATAILKQNHDE